MRTRSCWPVENSRGRCQAGRRVSIRSGKHGRESGGCLAILGWCSGFRLMSGKSPNGQILLHQRKLPLFLSLLGIKLVNLGFEPPLVLPKSFVVLSLLFKLYHVGAGASPVSRENKLHNLFHTREPQCGGNLPPEWEVSKPHKCDIQSKEARMPGSATYQLDFVEGLSQRESAQLDRRDMADQRSSGAAGSGLAQIKATGPDLP